MGEHRTETKDAFTRQQYIRRHDLLFVVQAKPLLEAGQVTELADPSLGDDYDKDQLNRMVAVASRCIMRPAMWRPSMAEVGAKRSC